MASSSSKLLAFFGTEFGELEEKEGVSKKPLAVENQIVTDEQGRRRFHGAFTGGFSAGYYNTVGTKEGWTPATFVSTRTQRNAEPKQKAEDYMDSEDLGEYGIAPRQIRATRDFAEKETEAKSNQGTKRRLAWEHSELSSEMDKLTELIKPVSESFGVQLLKRMGWRVGQGIGPRLSKKALLRQQAVETKVYDRPLAEDALSPEELEAVAPGFLFAPRDVDSHIFESKSDLHGLGYKGLQPGAVLTQKYGKKTKAVKTSTKQGQGIGGQAFGVGAFEDEDEDIYSTTDIAQYDYTLGGSGSSSFDDKHSAVGGDFEAAKKPPTARKFFPAPKVPREFVPKHEPKPLDVTTLKNSLGELTGRLNPLQRARLLGETHSVVSLLKDADRNKLQGAQKKDVKMIKMELPDTPPITLVPYPRDFNKQQRFTEYTMYLKRGLNMPQPPELTEWEWEKEVEDFRSHLPAQLLEALPEIQARKRPLARPEISMPFAHLLKSKFTHGQDGDEKGGTGREDDDKLQAVKMKMFGQMTREKHEWHPDRNLCKRFNLPNPYPDSTAIGVPHFQKEPKKEMFILGTAMLPSTAQELANRREAEDADNQSKMKAEEGETAEKGGEETSEERPAEDLFAAIFANSDAESEKSSDEEEEATETTSGDAVIKQMWTDPTASLLLPSSSSDYFPSTGPIQLPEVNDDDDVQDVQDVLMYGPAPPPSLDVPTLPASGVIGTRKTKERWRDKHRSRKDEDERRSSRKDEDEKSRRREPDEGSSSRKDEDERRSSSKKDEDERSRRREKDERSSSSKKKHEHRHKSKRKKKQKKSKKDTRKQSDSGSTNSSDASS